MKKIGLTGGIGSGKSTIAQAIKHIGYPVYIADEEAARLMNSHPDIRKDITERLGANCYTPEGHINKPVLAQIIFENKKALEEVNRIVHPRVMEAFEQWAAALPLAAAAHHRDDLFQVEALFLGQAGLLDYAAMGPRRSEAARADGHFAQMQAEYRYLAHKFRLRPMDGKLWKFLRLRPQNFPYIRISQLARLYHEGRTGLSRLLACADATDIERLYATSATPYWQEHYAFGEPGRRSAKRLSAQSLRLLTINTAIPTLFAYGRHSMDESLCRRAADLLESLPPEDNAIVRTWGGCGIRPANAAESQALVQLTRQYCDRRDCLRCRFGYEYLRKVKR